MIDTHCHIDDEQYAADLQAVIRRQQEAGVEAILVPGVNVKSCETVVAACRQFPGYLYPALGLHPEDVREDWRTQLATIRETIDALQADPAGPRLIAIGEIGLDYHWDVTYKHEQQEAFRTQLRWARELGLPVMVHARDAVEDTLYIIREELDAKEGDRSGLRGVMHCYSGSYEVACEYVKMGFYLGVGGVITFKNCKLADNLCPKDGRQPIPLTSLLLETDAPYMAPVPFRGQPNESRFMEYVVRKLAETYGTSEKEVISAANMSTNILFSIK